MIARGVPTTALHSLILTVWRKRLTAWSQCPCTRPDPGLILPPSTVPRPHPHYMAHLFHPCYGSYTLHGSGTGNGNGKNCMKLNSVRSHSLFQCNVNSSAQNIVSHLLSSPVPGPRSVQCVCAIKATLCGKPAPLNRHTPWNITFHILWNAPGNERGPTVVPFNVTKDMWYKSVGLTYKDSGLYCHQDLVNLIVQLMFISYVFKNILMIFT